ncbi:protein reticulata, chloroplastic [Galdieria sulphuraria]|nr:protein reticulata, chloroplastic [Galdieria sulphuraria]
MDCPVVSKVLLIQAEDLSSRAPDQTRKLDSSQNANSAYGSCGGNNNFGSRHFSQGSEGDPSNDVEFPLPVAKLFQKYNLTSSAFPEDLVLLLKSDALSPLQLEKIALIGTNSLYCFLCKVIPGLWPRLIGNPRFEFSLFAEVLIGVTTKTLSEIRKRGKSFQKEFDFYLSDISLEIIGDIALVWLLSPVFTFQGPAPQIKQFALPKHFLERGSYRFCASVIGHGITTGLVEMRRRKNPASISDVHLAPVLSNSTQWGLFMGISSNSRYQLVNGIEAQVIDRLFERTSLLASVCCFLLRCINSYVGGLHWIQWARHSGIQ